MVQRKNTQRLGWAAAALTAVALMSGCSHSDPAAVPASAPVVPAAMPAASTAAPGAPRDPHVSPMSPEDQAMMKQNDEKDKGAGAPP